MATSKVRRGTEPRGFDIVATIGRIEFGGDDKDAWTAAFEVIGESARELPYGGSRTYRFDPSGDESAYTTVEVTLPDGPADAGDDERG